MKHRRYLDGAGYFVNDDRPSGGRLSEDDVLGCAHCQKALKRKLWLNNGGYCSQCDQEICVECASKALTEGCASFARMVEREIAAQYVRDQNARILGI